MSFVLYDIALDICQIGIVCNARGLGHQAVKDAMATLLGNIEQNVANRVLRTKIGLEIGEGRAKLSVGLDGALNTAPRRIPIAIAAVINAVHRLGVAESNAELVAVALVIPIVAAVIAEGTAVLIIGVIGGIKRMDIAQEIAADAKIHADEKACNAHIGQIPR